MSKSVNVWSIYGAPKDDLGHSMQFYAPTFSAMKAIITEWDLDDPLVHRLDITLTRAGIAQALNDVIEELCINEG